MKMRAGPSGNGPKGKPERKRVFVPPAGARSARDHAGGLQKPALPEGHCSGGPVSRAPEGREGHAQKILIEKAFDLFLIAHHQKDVTFGKTVIGIAKELHTLGGFAHQNIDVVFAT